MAETYQPFTAFQLGEDHSWGGPVLVDTSVA
jgi:hypothetical protein